MCKNRNHDAPHRFWCLREPLMMCRLYKVNVCTIVHVLNYYKQKCVMRNTNNCIKHNNIILLKEKLTNSEKTVYIIN